MRKVNVIGYSTLYSYEYECFIVLGERVKIYNKSFQLMDRILEIKYPDIMKMSQDGRYVYVLTTEMVLYEIDLSDNSVKCLMKIHLKILTEEQNEMLEAEDFVVLDESHLLCLAGTMEAFCLILIDISPIAWKAVMWDIYVDGECGTRKPVRIVETDDSIKIVDTGFLSVKERDWPSLVVEPLTLGGVDKRIEIVRYGMVYEKSFLKRLNQKIIRLVHIIPDIDVYVLTDSHNTLYFVRPSSPAEKYELVLPVARISGIDNTWYDVKNCLLYLSINHFTVDTYVVVVSLDSGIEKPELVRVMSDYMDCITCPDGLFLLSQQKKPKSCIVRNLKERS